MKKDRSKYGKGHRTSLIVLVAIGLFIFGYVKGRRAAKRTIRQYANKLKNKGEAEKAREPRKEAQNVGALLPGGNRNSA